MFIPHVSTKQDGSCTLQLEYCTNTITIALYPFSTFLCSQVICSFYCVSFPADGGTVINTVIDTVTNTVIDTVINTVINTVIDAVMNNVIDTNQYCNHSRCGKRKAHINWSMHGDTVHEKAAPVTGTIAATLRITGPLCQWTLGSMCGHHL